MNNGLENFDFEEAEAQEAQTEAPEETSNLEELASSFVERGERLVEEAEQSLDNMREPFEYIDDTNILDLGEVEGNRMVVIEGLSDDNREEVQNFISDNPDFRYLEVRLPNGERYYAANDGEGRFFDYQGRLITEIDDEATLATIDDPQIIENLSVMIEPFTETPEVQPSETAEEQQETLEVQPSETAEEQQETPEEQASEAPEETQESVEALPTHYMVLLVDSEAQPLTDAVELHVQSEEFETIDMSRPALPETLESQLYNLILGNATLPIGMDTGQLIQLPGALASYIALYGNFEINGNLDTRFSLSSEEIDEQGEASARSIARTYVEQIPGSPFEYETDPEGNIELTNFDPSDLDLFLTNFTVSPLTDLKIEDVLNEMIQIHGVTRTNVITNVEESEGSDNG